MKPGQEPQEAYRVKKNAPYVPTPISDGELIYCWWDKGIVTCVDAATGKEHWKQRVGGDYFGSPVLVDGKLICLSAQGQAVVLAAGKTFKRLAANDLGESSHSTPAIANGKMYIRTFSHLMAVGG